MPDSSLNSRPERRAVAALQHYGTTSHATEGDTFWRRLDDGSHIG